MINRYRLRSELAPMSGLWKAALYVAAGILLFLVGLGLSFKHIIEPALEVLAQYTAESLKHIVPEENVENAAHFLGGAFLFLGSYFLFIGFREGVRRFVETLTGVKGGMGDIYMRRQRLARGPRIVAIGGGTGLSTLLRGLKQHSSNITAIVTVTDDGGSSGRLIQDKGMIPPGDIRNCLVALADAEKSMTDLFQHRFKKDSGTLSGHSMGNLLIAALVDQCHGDFEMALEKASDVLAIRGRVVPATLAHVRLRALLENGMEICGETAITEAGHRIRQIYLDPAEVEPYAAALDAIRNADVICIGPGSVYTSVIPNLLVPGIAQALREARAPKVYICNVMTQPGESDSFSAAEHVTALLTNVGARIFDYVLINTGVPSESAIEKYREVGQYLVEADADRVRMLGYRPLIGNYMSETDVVRHDPMKVAARLMGLIGR